MSRIWFHKAHRDNTLRYFFYYNIKGNEFRQFKAQLEIPWRRWVSPGFSFSIGDSGSETPVDFMISFYWLAFFFGIDWPGLGKFCEKIGGGHKREISLRVHDGSVLWWQLWYDDNMGYDDHHNCDKWRKPKLWPWSAGRKKYRSWMCLRDGNIPLNPFDAFWGKPTYHYESRSGTARRLYIDQFPGDDYVVTLTLQDQTCFREHGPRWARRVLDRKLVVDWRSKEGIPYQNHDWKGDNVYGSAVAVSEVDGWVHEACDKIVERIKAMRERSGYKPPNAPKESYR